jgi:hypothetical protein
VFFFIRVSYCGRYGIGHECLFVKYEVTYV